MLFTSLGALNSWRSRDVRMAWKRVDHGLERKRGRRETELRASQCKFGTNFRITSNSGRMREEKRLGNTMVTGVRQVTVVCYIAVSR